jgi:circadian clock protein KaiC
MRPDTPLPSQVMDRVPSTVPGLDRLLGGGFFRGGVYMVLATPGSGKTILGNQIAFGHVAAGGRALYVTLLTESHARLIASLQGLAFFDPTRVGVSLSYVTSYAALEKDKLKGLLAQLRQLIRDHKATLLVIDGFVTAGSMAETEIEAKKFIHELQVFVELVGCTTLLLTGGQRSSDQYALRTMVDGLVKLRRESGDMEQARSIEIKKFRGGPVLMGRHLLEITDAGLTVYPRTESYRGRQFPGEDAAPDALAEFGIKGLDVMLGGGLRSRSLTMLMGAPGSGKTLLGLTWLARGARQREAGLYFGFFEPPSDLRRRAAEIGLDLGEHTKSGNLELVWQSPLDGNADALAEKLLARLREGQFRRLFIDGIDSLRASLVYPSRWRRFFAALTGELRSLGVVTVLSDELKTLKEFDGADDGITSMLDNVLSLRHTAVRSTIQRVVSITKMRERGGDGSLREFSIGRAGFVLSPSRPVKPVHAPKKAVGRRRP